MDSSYSVLPTKNLYTFLVPISRSDISARRAGHPNCAFVAQRSIVLTLMLDIRSMVPLTTVVKSLRHLAALAVNCEALVRRCREVPRSVQAPGPFQMRY